MSIEDSPELRAVVELWNGLPKAVRVGIVAMVQATNGGQGAAIIGEERRAQEAVPSDRRGTSLAASEDR